MDWSRGYESLDKELHQIVHDAEVGARLADKLFKVWLRDGAETWLLIHVEVQGKREQNFSERMYVYSYRIFDVFHRAPVSMALLCDDSPNWKPAHFEYNILGCTLDFRFHMAKILDHRGDEERLEQDVNPFAAIVAAQLKAMETKHAPESRRVWKTRLIKGLYQRGLGSADIRQLFRLIDWMLRLPKKIAGAFWLDIIHFEEEQHMPFITTGERIGMEKGLTEGLILALEMKFGSLDDEFVRAIQAVEDIDKLRKIAQALKSDKTLKQIRRMVKP